MKSGELPDASLVSSLLGLIFFCLAVRFLGIDKGQAAFNFGVLSVFFFALVFLFAEKSAEEMKAEGIDESQIVYPKKGGVNPKPKTPRPPNPPPLYKNR